MSKKLSKISEAALDKFADIAIHLGEVEVSATTAYMKKVNAEYKEAYLALRERLLKLEQINARMRAEKKNFYR